MGAYNKQENQASCPNPEECQKKHENGEGFREVIGDFSGYHRDSNVCLAAQHAKVLIKTLSGWQITLSKVGKKNQFNGVESNGVISKSIKGIADAFQVRTLEITCPQTIYKHMTKSDNSFLQTLSKTFRR